SHESPAALSEPGPTLALRVFWGAGSEGGSVTGHQRPTPPSRPIRGAGRSGWVEGPPRSARVLPRISSGIKNFTRAILPQALYPGKILHRSSWSAPGVCRSKAPCDSKWKSSPRSPLLTGTEGGTVDADLWTLSALELAGLVARGEVSALEVVDDHLHR